jgi:hypothetical protein
VLYILYREYLHKNPGLKTLDPEDPRYQHYVERRLRQLYPTRGYAGIMRDAVEERKRQMQAWTEYERLRERDGIITIQACDGMHDYDPETGQECFPSNPEPEPEPDPTRDGSWDGVVEFSVPADSVIPTLQMEIDTLQMEAPEVQWLYYQESLATGSFFRTRNEEIVTMSGAPATLDDLIVAAGGGWTPQSATPKPDGEITIQVNPSQVAAVTAGLSVIGWKAFRVVQAAERAEQKSTQYFGSLVETSTRRDAHRHIFWNMQMRRYVGSFLTKQIGDLNEAWGNNEPADRAMDVHNNDIGREVKYEAFRGHWLWDRWDWKEWGEKVRNYVSRPENGVYILEWRTTSPTLSEALARANMVPNAKYIYFAP